MSGDPAYLKLRVLSTLGPSELGDLELNKWPPLCIILVNLLAIRIVELIGSKVFEVSHVRAVLVLDFTSCFVSYL